MADLDQSQDQTAQPAGGLSQAAQIAVPVNITGGTKPGDFVNIGASKGMLMDETTGKSVLENMKKLMEQYDDPMRNFQQNLQRMHAWTQYDKVPAFRQIEEQEQQDRAAKYNLAQQMAALQANQASAQRQAQSLAVPAGGASVAGGLQEVGGVSMPGPIDATTQAEINRYLQNGDLAGANAARKKAFDTWQDAKVKRQFSTDLDAPVEGVIVNGKPTTVTRRVLIEMMNRSPETAAILKQQNPQLNNLPPLTPSAPRGQAEDIAKSLGVPIISGYRDPNDPKNAALYAQRKAQGLPVAEPGSSPHAYGYAIDVDSSKLTTKNRQDLIDAGFVQPLPKTDPNHWEIRAAQAHIGSVNPKTGDINDGLPPASTKEEYNARLENVKMGNEAFLKGQYKDLSDLVNAQKNDKINASMALDAVKNNQFGPGTGIWQETSKMLQAAGLPAGPKETQRYLDNLNIERARQLFAASGARAAMGAQFTENESNQFKQTLAGINDPKEYIKMIYQLKYAEAEINEQHLKYLDSHPGSERAANLAWKNSGVREKILNSTVDAFKKNPISLDGLKENKPTETKPAEKRTVVKTGTINKPGHPDNGKTVTLYSDGTRETK